MNKIAIAVVALPLACMGAGYATGLTIAPDPSESSADADETGAHAEQAAGQEKGYDKDHAAKGDTPAQDKAHGKDGEAASTDHYADPNMPPKDPKAVGEDSTILRLGQMTVPVSKPQSVTYIVADFAIKMDSYKMAEHYKGVQEGTRLRDALLTGMNLAAESPLLRGVSIDSDALSAMLREHLKAEHEGIEDVLFVSLFKQDVPRL